MVAALPQTAKSSARFTGVLQEMARELRRRGVTHVVMEASGVYTEPVYYALCEQDFEQVAVINAAHAKALRGHKTDPPRTAPALRSCLNAVCCGGRISRRRS
jgi:transposase